MTIVFIRFFSIFDREYDSRGPRNTKDVPGEQLPKKHSKILDILLLHLVNATLNLKNPILNFKKQF